MEGLSVLRDRFAQPDAAAELARQYQELVNRAQQANAKPKPSSFFDAVGNVGAGLARDIPRAASWFAEQARKPAGEVQSDFRNFVGGAARAVAEIPKRNFEALENYRQTGEYDAAPAVDAVTTLAGGASPFAQRGAAGAFGGNLAREAILPGDTRVSTRFPTAVKRTEDPLTHHLSIGTDEMRLDPKNFERNTALLGDYPGFAKLKGMSPDEAAAGYIEQAKGNLNYLYDKSPAEMRARSPRWYEGANEISDAFAKRWGIPRQSASAALAALSPQKDWFMNASLGERVGDIVTANPKTTPDMMSWLRGNKEFMKGPGAEDIVRSIEGKRLSALDPEQSAVAVRAFDQAHNTRNYRSILPEGEFGDFITTQKGDPAKVAWGTFGDIDKATRAIQSGGDMNVISPLLGNKHKVRSFYNNIEVPFDARYGDITGDTHQVAAGQMRPLSGTAEAVTQHLASGGAAGAANAGSSAVSGVQGTYGLIADATRQMANERGMLARAGQSATWEPVRELFPSKFKNVKNVALIDDIWKAHDAGQLTLDQARDAVFKAAGGIGLPEWARPGISKTSPLLGSTYR